MATRTIKLYGKAYSTSGDVSLTVNFNNTSVFSGTVTTINEASPTKGQIGSEIASWTVDTSVTGAIPLSIAVSNGTFHFHDLEGNYAGVGLQDTDNDGNPDVVDGAYVVTTQPADYYGVLNHDSASSDGKDNVTITPSDGADQTRTITDSTENGDWVYIINDGQTLSCDFTIHTDFTVTTVPTP